MPVFWPGEFHGERKQAVYSQWGYKESEITEWLSLPFTLNSLLVFPTFFNLSLNFEIRTSWSEPQWTPGIESCLTLCNPMNCRLPGSSVHWIFQARILEQIAISFSRGSAWPKNQTQDSVSSCTGRQILNHCATWGSIIVTVSLVPDIYSVPSSNLLHS